MSASSARTRSSHSASSRWAGLAGRPWAHASASMYCRSSAPGSRPRCSPRHAAINRARLTSILFDRRDSGRTTCASCAISPSALSVYPRAAKASIQRGSVRAASSPSALTTVWSFIATRESRLDHLPSTPCTFMFSHRCRWLCGSSARERRCCSSTTSMRRDVFANAPAVPTPRIELALPERDRPVARPILERLEIGGERRIEQGSNAVGLREVDRAIEEEVGILRSVHLAAWLARCRILALDPPSQRWSIQFVPRGHTVHDGEARDARAVGVARGRGSTQRFAVVSIARSTERVGNRIAHAARRTPRFQLRNPPRMPRGYIPAVSPPGMVPTCIAFSFRVSARTRIVLDASGSALTRWEPLYAVEARRSYGGPLRGAYTIGVTEAETGTVLDVSRRRDVVVGGPADDRLRAVADSDSMAVPAALVSSRPCYTNGSVCAPYPSAASTCQLQRPPRRRWCERYIDVPCDARPLREPAARLTPSETAPIVRPYALSCREVVSP